MNEAGSQNLKAFLDMIAFSELGERLIKESDNGYNVIVGSLPGRMKLFHDYSDHPRQRVQINSTLYSTAAGRYQILKRTFDAYKKILGLSDFSPASQDAIAVQLIRERGAIRDIENGNLFSAIEKVANIWASLPGAGYGQHENDFEDLLDAYLDAGGDLAQVTT